METQFTHVFGELSKILEKYRDRSQQAEIATDREEDKGRGW